MKQLEIDYFLSNHDNISKSKKKVIKRYLSGIIREDKDLDIKPLFSLLEEHVDHNNETFAAWVNKMMNKKKCERNAASEQMAYLWMSKNEIPKNIKKKIKKYIQLRLQDGKDVDINHILHILPPSDVVLIKKHMFHYFKHKDEVVYDTICNYLKPVTYSENSYIIRKGEPLDMMLFITQGVVWTFGNTTSPMSRLQKGEFYGNELIEWRLKSTSYDEFPISLVNVKTHNNVEALALMAINLERVLSKCWYMFSRTYSSMPESLKPFAIDFLQQLMLRWAQRRRKKIKSRQSGEISVDMY
ncbi:cyclic nucleotide-gated ion channel 1-like [Humulus lupulus]|uniref:cyclic nucleotide-gated ion channel 1-like n=1 Tax=Humulus lupulus TaxID=3486 RepID=UPI002B41047E|nr:cyclic nucleotide-gated ion channel 1-like [Humulus lupulus]